MLDIQIGHLRSLGERQVSFLEQAHRQCAMHADIEKPVIEGNGEDGRPPVFRNDGEASSSAFRSSSADRRLRSQTLNVATESMCHHLWM